MRKKYISKVKPYTKLNKIIIFILRYTKKICVDDDWNVGIEFHCSDMDEIGLDEKKYQDIKDNRWRLKFVDKDDFLLHATRSVNNLMIPEIEENLSPEIIRKLKHGILGKRDFEKIKLEMIKFHRNGKKRRNENE